MNELSLDNSALQASSGFIVAPSNDTSALSSCQAHNRHARYIKFALRREDGTFDIRMVTPFFNEVKDLVFNGKDPEEFVPATLTNDRVTDVMVERLVQDIVMKTNIAGKMKI